MRNVLLAKSNLRKNKGLSLCIMLLILISSMFICLSGLLVFDYDDNAMNVAKSLDTTEQVLFSLGDSRTINKEYIDSVIPESVTEYEYEEVISTQTPIEFNNGEVTPIVNILNKNALNRKLSRIEILEEDKSIKDHYIYLPYHMYTGGGIKIGDTYKIKFPARTYTFKVKGFINTIYAGSYNMNKYEMLVSDEDYKTIEEENPDTHVFNLYLNFKDDFDANKESNKLVNKIFIDKNIECTTYSLDLTLLSRTFISMIFLASFLVISLIIIAIVILMISNNISNYIRENFKNLGALKAMGYTSKDIKKSLLLQFGFLTVVGLIFGIISCYLFMPVIADMLIAQSGIPYHTTFNLAATLFTLVLILLIIFIATKVSTRKINKVEPIVALRDGVETHSFKKNHIPLSKSRLPLNISLSLKNMHKNLKQNIISFITVLFLCFLMVTSMAMYQNFSREPNLSLMTFEIVDGVIIVDKDIEKEFEKDLENDKEIDKYEYLTQYEIQDKDYNHFQVYILKDYRKLNNQDSCYKGRYPKYDNEVVISGVYAKENGYEIGDSITFQVGDKKYNYLITGFIQTTNNGGRESVFTYDGIIHIVDPNNIDPGYFFDSNVKAKKIIEKYNKKYGDKIITTLNFEELLESQMDTFINIANLMAVMTCIITGSIIMLVLYLLMKTLIYNRRYEYGILKAVGYRSRDLIKQNVLAFMPTIIIATLIGTTVSYFLVNPYIGFMMRPFGIMKCTMNIPMDLIIISILFIIGISTIMAILMSLKIKKVEPTNLLAGE